MTGLGIILAHLVGDYLLQTHWMATEKTSRWWPAIAHGITYTIPYMFVTQSPLALLVISGTHIVIDRYRLARHLVWLMIVSDNTIHLLINTGAVIWL